jgi:hypothetical protein
VSDGGFSASDGLAPFAWAYSSDGGLYADRIVAEGNNGRASIRAEAGAGADAIKQLLLLRAGSYKFSATAGNIPSEERAKFVWTIRCAKTEAVLAAISLKPVAGKAGRYSEVFSVPAQECPAQWLALTVRAEMDGEGDDPWIDDVAIAKN